MTRQFIRVALSGAVLCCVVLIGASAETVAPAKPATAKSDADAAALSSEFWTDWKAKEASKDFVALKSAVQGADKIKPTPAPAPTATPAVAKQRVVDIAIGDPAEAAKVLSDGSAAVRDASDSQALATVVNMVASPQTLQEAAPLVAPEAQTRVEEFRANLSSGIPGLPGIYLGDNSGSVRSAMPSVYVPVSGGSAGCPSR